MEHATRPATFPRIVRDPRIVGGEPTIRGTRVAVRHVAIEYQNEGSVEGVHRAYPHLSTDAIREALAFYAANREEIDGYIDENEALADSPDLE